MLDGIMRFLDRLEEMEHLDGLVRRGIAGFAILYGRRRMGKTRLLLEWVKRHGGSYAVGDLSAPHIQRRYVADALSVPLAALRDTEFRDWRSLLRTVAREAAAARWRGPVVLDELPYLVVGSPELPTVLQQWIDHEAREARLVVAVAGSSQRMMQGLVLPRGSPLYGRAQVVLEVGPLAAPYLAEAFPRKNVPDLVQAYAAWGGVPRYWELAADEEAGLSERIERLVLDPLGPLHREPDMLMLEEIPSALEVRPVLDAIGAGAHRPSEIGARLARPATSLSRPLARLLELGLVHREHPFGDPERGTKRSLYRIVDPFMRLWFRVVGPHRSMLQAGTSSSRARILRFHWPNLAAEAWEDLCRTRIPRLPPGCPVAGVSDWSPGLRWWHGVEPAWDVVSESLDGGHLLLGEVKWSQRRLSRAATVRALSDLAARPEPALPGRYSRHARHRALFIPEGDVPSAGERAGCLVVTADQVLGSNARRRP
jgi:AAA+ ATPase superfamily predicted ATPase